MLNQDQIQTKYLRRAKIIATILQTAPFVRMVGLNGSLARGEATENSDIDFLIIAKKNRLWSARALVTAMVHLTGFRRYNGKIAGRVCLNRYQTDDYLKINPLTSANAEHHSYSIILWSDQNLGGKMIRANQWMNKFGFAISPQKPKLNAWRLLTRPIQFLGEFLFDLIFNDWGERTLKFYQTQRILKDPRTKNSPLGSIYVSDQELRFHPHKKNLTNLRGG